MREIVHLQAGQCGNQIGAKVSQFCFSSISFFSSFLFQIEILALGGQKRAVF